jgi:hypothetical protein
VNVKNNLAISYVCAQSWHPLERLFMSGMGVFIGFFLGLLICLIFNVPEADWRPVWGAMATLGSIPWTAMPLIGNTYYAKGLNDTEKEILDRYRGLSVESRQQFPEFESIFWRMHDKGQLTRKAKQRHYPYDTIDEHTDEAQKIYDALSRVRGAEKKRAAQIAAQDAENNLLAIESDLNAFVERAEREAEIIAP